ncbi:MAG: hypothetical protein II458_02770 [Oscillospiraceae bacterium]|nr:hypothetical protein [Oscillospiraceae bacterium]
MRSATSCSKTLIRSDWRRFWPLTFLYAFISFFIMPVQIWNEGSYSSYTGVVLSQAQMKTERAFRMAEYVYNTLSAYAIINLILGVGLAMVLFGYMMKSNSVGLMHALPVTRTRQFLAHFGAGMSMLTAANLLTFLMSLLMEGLIGVVDVVPLLIWLLAVELMGFFFLAFGTLCAMATGWLLAVPVIYFGLNFVVMAYYAIIRGIAAILWTGYSPDYAPGLFVRWMTPVVKLSDTLRVPNQFNETAYRDGATLFSAAPEALSSVLIYALAGAAMLVFALILYRARQSETAGDAIVFPWLRPVVKYVISVAAGLALGLFIHTVFFGGGRNVVGLLICQIIMGALTFCGLEMLLRKSYKIFDGRTLLGLAALALVIVAVCVCVRSDITGYQKRVPVTEQVASVEINATGIWGTNTDDPAVIDAVTKLHRVLIQQGASDDGSESVYFSMNYRLKNGDHMSRSYTVDLQNREAYDALSALLSCPGVNQNRLLRDRGEYGEKFVGGYAINYMFENQQLQLTAAQARDLYRALEEDADVSLKPEDLLSNGDELPIDLELETDKGTYGVYSIPTRCEKTLDLLEEYGITIPEEFYKFGKYGK